MPAGRARARGARRGGPRGAALLAAAAACLVLAPGPGWASGRQTGAPRPRVRGVVGRLAEEKPAEVVKRPLADLKVGEVLEGKVIRKTSEGVRLDFGCEVYGHTVNPRKEALDKLEARQIVSATVERLDPEARVFWVSVAGLSKGKLCSDMKEGDVVDGTVVLREKSRVKVDIDCEMTAILPDKERTRDVFKLELGEEVKGLVVESVDGNKVTLSFPGLSDLVADRAEPDRAPPKPKKKVDPKAFAKEDGFRLMSLNANDLRKDSFKGVRLELSGGLAFDSIDMINQTLTLKKTKELDFFQGFKKGQAVKGTIKNKIRNAVVYADIGARRNAKVVASPEALLLKWGEEIDFVIERVNHEKGFCDVAIPGLAEITAGRAAKTTEMKDLEVGSIVSGRIEGKIGQYDSELWVDIGSSKAARVWVHDRSVARKLQSGVEVQVRLDKVDLVKSQVEAQLHVE